MGKTSTISDAVTYGLNDEYWERLTPEQQAMYRHVRPLRNATYTVSQPISHIASTLETLAEDARKMGGELLLNPDFQRGHVWDQARQIAFMESVLRGLAPMTIRFNCANWDLHAPEVGADGMNPNDIVCVDGLQRLTAMLAFIDGAFPVFGKYYAADLKGGPFAMERSTYRWTMEMFDIKTRRDLLTFYLDINRGGVVHSDEELARVEALRDGAAPDVKASGKKTRKTPPTRS